MEETWQFVGAAKVNSGTLDGQGEGSDTNTGDTPFSVGRSPQNGTSGVERTSGTGGLGEGTPKVRSFFVFYDMCVCVSFYIYVYI